MSIKTENSHSRLVRACNTRTRTTGSGIDQTVSRLCCACHVVVVVVVAGRLGSVAMVVRISSFPLSGRAPAMPTSSQVVLCVHCVEKSEKRAPHRQPHTPNGRTNFQRSRELRPKCAVICSLSNETDTQDCEFPPFFSTAGIMEARGRLKTRHVNSAFEVRHGSKSQNETDVWITKCLCSRNCRTERLKQTAKCLYNICALVATSEANPQPKPRASASTLERKIRQKKIFANSTQH